MISHLRVSASGQMLQIVTSALMRLHTRRLLHLTAFGLVQHRALHLSTIHNIEFERHFPIVSCLIRKCQSVGLLSNRLILFHNVLRRGRSQKTKDAYTICCTSWSNVRNTSLFVHSQVFTFHRGVAALRKLKMQILVDAHAATMLEIPICFCSGITAANMSCCLASNTKASMQHIEYPVR